MFKKTLGSKFTLSSSAPLNITVWYIHTCSTTWPMRTWAVRFICGVFTAFLTPFSMQRCLVMMENAQEETLLPLLPLCFNCPCLTHILDFASAALRCSLCWIIWVFSVSVQPIRRTSAEECRERSRAVSQLVGAILKCLWSGAIVFSSIYCSYITSLWFPECVNWIGEGSTNNKMLNKWTLLMKFSPKWFRMSTRVSHRPYPWC